jgi:hypothetical protein
MQYILSVGWMPPRRDITGDMTTWGAEEALECMDATLYLSAAILQLLSWCWILVKVFDGIRGGNRGVTTTHRADQFRKQQ